MLEDYGIGYLLSIAVPGRIAPALKIDLAPAHSACDKRSMRPTTVSDDVARGAITGPPESATFLRLSRILFTPFVRFLADLEANGDDAVFHPHRFDSEAASHIVTLAEIGSDEYWLLVADEVLAYGMLRGWTEGYAVPSLGLAVAHQHRGRGLARMMMYHLHDRAIARGASHVRLKVDRNNHAAYRLYKSLGYVFQEHSTTELLGLLKLPDGAQDPRTRRGTMP